MGHHWRGVEGDHGASKTLGFGWFLAKGLKN